MKKKHHLRSLFPFYRQHLGKVVLFIIFSIIGGLILLAVPFASSRIMINLTGGIYEELVKYSLLLFLLVTLNLIAEFFSQFFYAQASAYLFFDIRRETVNKTMDLNLGTIYDKGSGFFLERLNEDSRELSIVFLSVLKTIISLIINLGFIVYITILDPLLGLVFAGGLVILIVLEHIRIKYLLVNQKKQKRAIEKVKSNETEILKGIKEIKGLDAKAAILDRHTMISMDYIKIRRNREVFSNSLTHAISFVKGLTDLAVLLFAALYLLPRGLIELAAVLVVYNYKGSIYELIAGVARIKDLVVNGELAAKRIDDIIKAPSNESDTFGTAVLLEPAYVLSLKHVSFGYLEDQVILNDISFTLKEHGLYGFVGKSGSGKSTIFSLLARFYKPRSGEIFLNDFNLDLLEEHSLKNQITIVLQDPYIFNDTIYNNLRLAKIDATKEEIEIAAKRARIHDEILEMKDGYQTLVGENGATISGGQKQRLEIARALLKNTKIILFDEATSALDKTNLEHINKLLKELSKEKIIMVIAHRLGVMRECDAVIVLDGGKIIAQGHHDTLIKTTPYYQELFTRSKETEIKE
ncbi:MAG: ABC transporter ATP-binding protein/permease [Erysipelotrichaceae bacterium]|jgi:ABC-type multidrug transport system fused ATPase/permease subunit|nr:ABC transporter ATP-binding protein/permease [Erysipelotrichaceae bacterium]